jgi:LysM repeat protein
MKHIPFSTRIMRAAALLSLAMVLIVSEPRLTSVAQAAPAQTNAPATASRSGVCTATYSVKFGDTLSQIGVNFNVNWMDIAQVNGLSSPYWLYPGQALCIPADATLPAVTRLHFLTGTTFVIASSTMQAGQTRYYVLRALQSQPLITNVSSLNNEATLSIVAPGGTALASAPERRFMWQGRLPATGDYYIGVHTGPTTGTVSLAVTVGARVQMLPGANSAILTGQTIGGNGVTYVAAARQGQVMSLNLTGVGTNAALTVWGFTDGQPYLRDVAEQTSLSMTLHSSQDYVIVVSPRAGAVVNYTLVVKII